MNKIQVAKQNRNKSLELVIDDNNLVWNGTVAFKDIYEDEFQITVEDIDKANERQKSATTGVAIDKLNKKTAMTKKSLRVAGAVKAYAEAINDQTLFSKVDYTESELMGASAVNSRNRCQIIYDQANGVLANLAPYGIANLAVLSAAIEAFNLFIGGPKNARAMVKTATQDLKTFTKKADTLLRKKLTPMMELFRESAPQFYSDYHNALRIDDPKTIFTELQIIFRDKNTQQPLEGVKVTANGEEGDTYELISKTNGVADEKQIKPEIYDLTYVLPGYETGHDDDKKVKLGQKLVLEVELKPVV